MVFIYVLKLKNDKYYIGETDDINFKLTDCDQNNWTILHKPIEIIEFKSNRNVDNYTVKYMYKYGLSNVRGGQFNNIILTNEQYNIIEKKIQKNNNDIKTETCYTCNNKFFIEEYTLYNSYGSESEECNNLSGSYDNINDNYTIKYQCINCYKTIFASSDGYNYSVKIYE